jgi:hypothetical protein
VVQEVPALMRIDIATHVVLRIMLEEVICVFIEGVNESSL